MLALHPHDSAVIDTDAIRYPSHWHLRQHSGLGSLLYSTHADFHDPELQSHVVWTSRRHRKGRRIKVKPLAGHTIIRRFPRLWGWEFGNISWWVAQFFLWGSAVWCVQGCFAFIPLSNVERNAYVTGYLALLGGTLFEVGAYFVILEAVNQRSSVRFGYEVKHLIEKNVKAEFHPVKGMGHYGGGHLQSQSVSGQPSTVEMDVGASSSQQKWKWWGFRPHSLGYLAALLTFTGATIFWVSTITGVPDVLPAEEDHVALWDCLYWSPQVLGGCFFIFAPLLLMLETQRKWWKPKPLDIGWQVALWNLIGGVGFWLCGIFGYWAYPSGTKQHYGTAFSTFWGSWAFLIGSYAQLYEMLN